MRNLLLLRVIATLGACLPVLAHAAESPQWGPWLPLKDGAENGVKIAFKQFPNGTLRYKLRNDYMTEVTVSCRFRYTSQDGKVMTESGCDGKLAPGQEKTDPGYFDFGVREVDYSSLSAKVSGSARAPASSQGTPSDMGWATCDHNADDLDQKCNSAKLRCNSNVYEWCAAQFGKEGTQANQDHRAQYNQCVSSRMMGCEASRTQCIAGIRHCSTGQTCNARTSTCEAVPSK